MNKRAIWILLLITALVAGTIIYMRQKVHTAFETLNNSLDSSNRHMDTTNRHMLDSLSKVHDDIERKRTELEQKIDSEREHKQKNHH